MMYNDCVLHNPWAARHLDPSVFIEMPKWVAKDRGRSFIELECCERMGRLLAFFDRDEALGFCGKTFHVHVRQVRRRLS